VAFDQRTKPNTLAAWDDKVQEGTTMSRFHIFRSPAFTATMIGVLVVCAISISELAIRAGEPPSVATPPTKAPAKSFSPAEQKIRDALDGRSPVGETGDGVLDDVLGIIKQRRSILQGSSLDPINSDSQTTGGRHSVSKMALAAEQVLKAARLLENVGRPDQGRADLVKRMRAEAVKLLSE
jgi:hypothetical protein